ncbi:hypothetical protein E2C01_070273 [Portunus trituberculatus]|uniref:Uncharacterized protein n=1 Tax=Portunus trituberculatus TaxID=210409 RepID=A0A5B7I1N3_PORTR|nr:hypothetical protein [Portunus trituberculatus]
MPRGLPLCAAKRYLRPACACPPSHPTPASSTLPFCPLFPIPIAPSLLPTSRFTPPNTAGPFPSP